MLCGVEEALDVQQLRCGCRIEGFEDDFKEGLGGHGWREIDFGDIRKIHCICCLWAG